MILFTQFQGYTHSGYSQFSHQFRGNEYFWAPKCVTPISNGGVRPRLATCHPQVFLKNMLYYTEKCWCHQQTSKFWFQIGYKMLGFSGKNLYTSWAWPTKFVSNNHRSFGNLNWETSQNQIFYNLLTIFSLIPP